MRVIVADDHGNVVADYSTVAGANMHRPDFGDEGHAIAILAETIQFLAPPLEERLLHIYAHGEVPAPKVRKVPTLRLVEAEPAPTH